MNKTKIHPLKAARERRNLSQRQLADFTQLGLATIQRAEQGKVLRPDVRQRLSDFFGMSSLDLGLVQEVEQVYTHKTAFKAELQDQTRQTDGKDVDRRNFLQTSLETATGAFVAPVQTLLSPEPWERFSKALKRSSIIDQTTLSHLEMLAHNSWQLIPDVTGVVSSKLRDYSITHLLNVTELLEGPLIDNTRKRLSSIGSEFSLIAASMSANLRDFDAAQSYYHTSIEAAREANNYQLEAVGLASLAIRLTHLKHADKALPLVQEARRLAVQDSTPTTRTWLAAVEAEVQASLQDYTACRRALDDAGVVPEQYLVNDDPYMTTFGPSLYAGYKGVCLMKLGEPEAAYKVLSEALTHLSTPSIYRRCYILTDLASTCIERKDIEEACTYARQALMLTARAKSPALWQRMNDIRRQLEPWDNLQVVKDFNTQLHNLKI